MSAVIEAAADLFAAQGPAATSIRQVATRSGVNHGLVYRHFGTKDQLVAAVLDHVSDRLNAAVAQADGSAAGAEAERQWRVLARAILDGYPVGHLQRHFPGTERLVEEARQHASDERAARFAAAHVLALELGWRLFEPFIRSAAGLEDEAESQLRRASLETSARILHASTAQPLGAS